MNMKMPAIETILGIWHEKCTAKYRNFVFKVNIWEERKVFGSRGQILKEEILGRQPENGTRNGPLVPLKLVSQSLLCKHLLTSEFICQ